MDEDKVLSREDIIQAADLGRPVPVEVPEWGGTVYVRQITAAERDQWEARIVAEGARPQNVRAGLLVYALADAEGKRLFADEDVTRLGRKSAKVLDRLFDVARRVNALGEEDLEELQSDFPKDQPAG